MGMFVRKTNRVYLKLLFISVIVLCILDIIAYLSRMRGVGPPFSFEIFSAIGILPPPEGNPILLIASWLFTVFILWLLLCFIYWLVGRERLRKLRDWLVAGCPPTWLVSFYRFKTSIFRSGQFVSYHLRGRSFYIVLFVVSAALVIGVQVLHGFLLKTQSYSISLALNVTDQSSPALDVFSLSKNTLESSSSVSFLSNNASQSYITYNATVPVTPYSWINWGDILTFDILGKVLGIFILLALMKLLWDSRSTLVIEEFEDDTGDAGRDTGGDTKKSGDAEAKSGEGSAKKSAAGNPQKTQASGMASLLLVELNRINQLYCEVNEQRAIHTSVGDRSQVAAVLRVDDPGDVLNTAMSADSKVAIGPIQISLSSFTSLVNRIVGGPRIRGRLQKSRDGYLLVVSMSGTSQPYGWKIFVSETKDQPDQDTGDSAHQESSYSTALQKGIEELACRIFTDIPATGSFKWEATDHFNRGLRKYRECLLTSKDQTVNLADAEKEFLKARTFDNTFTAAYHNLGVVYLESGRSHAAEKAFLKAIEQDPNEADIHHALALTRYNRYWTGKPVIFSEKSGNPHQTGKDAGNDRDRDRCTLENEILNHCRQAEALDPENPQNLNLMALTFLELHKLEQECDRENAGSSEHGISLEESKKYQTKAMAAAWRQFYRLNPYYNQADYYARRRWHDTYSFLCYCAGWLGWVYLHRDLYWKKLPTKSYSLMSQAMTLHEQSYGTECCPELHWMSGVVNLCRSAGKTYNEACADFRKAVESSPSVMKYHASLALTTKLQKSRQCYGFEKVLPYALPAFEEKDERRGDQWKEIDEMCRLLQKLPFAETKERNSGQQEPIEKTCRSVEEFVKKDSEQMFDFIQKSLHQIISERKCDQSQKNDEIVSLLGDLNSWKDNGFDREKGKYILNKYNFLPGSDFILEVEVFKKQLLFLECIAAIIYRAHRYIDVFNPFPYNEDQSIRKKIDENIRTIQRICEVINSPSTYSNFEILKNWIEGHNNVLRGRFEFLKASYKPWIITTESPCDSTVINENNQATYKKSRKYFSSACENFSQFPEECVERNLNSRIARTEAEASDEQHDYYKAFFYSSFGLALNPFSDYQAAVDAVLVSNIEDYERAAKEYWDKAVALGYGAKVFKRNILCEHLKSYSLSITRILQDLPDKQSKENILDTAGKNLENALALLRDVYARNACPDDSVTCKHDGTSTGFREDLAAEYLNGIFALRYYIGLINYRKGVLTNDTRYYSEALSQFRVINTFYKPNDIEKELPPCERLYEEYVITLFWIGEMYYLLKKYDEAYEIFGKIIKNKDVLTDPSSVNRFYGFGFNIRCHSCSLLVRALLMQLRILAERTAMIGPSNEYLLCNERVRNMFTNVLHSPDTLIRIYHQIDTVIDEFNCFNQKITYREKKEKIKEEIKSITSEYCKIKAIVALSCATQQSVDSEYSDPHDQKVFTCLNTAKDHLREAIALLPDPESYILLLKTIRKMIEFLYSDKSDKDAPEKKDLLRLATGYCETLKNIWGSSLGKEDLAYMGGFCKEYKIPVTFGEMESTKPKTRSVVCCVVPSGSGPEEEGDDK